MRGIKETSFYEPLRQNLEGLYICSRESIGIIRKVATRYSHYLYGHRYEVDLAVFFEGAVLLSRQTGRYLSNPFFIEVKTTGIGSMGEALLQMLRYKYDGSKLLTLEKVGDNHVFLLFQDQKWYQGDFEVIMDRVLWHLGLGILKQVNGKETPFKGTLNEAEKIWLRTKPWHTR